jgi:hypothetical protein
MMAYFANHLLNAAEYGGVPATCIVVTSSDIMSSVGPRLAARGISDPPRMPRDPSVVRSPVPLLLDHCPTMVFAVDLNCEGLSEQQLASPRLSHLMWLRFRTTDRSGSWSFLLNFRRSLIALHIDDANSIDDKQMQQFILELSNLEELTLHSFSGTHVTDAGLIGLSEQLPRLRKLDLSFARNITDTGLQHIVGLPQLTDLSLADADITDSGCAAIATMKTLVRLHIGFHCTVTQLGVKSIADGLEHLVELRFEAKYCIYIIYIIYFLWCCNSTSAHFSSQPRMIP